MPAPTSRGPTLGHGDPQRHPRLVLGRWPVVRDGPGGRPGPRDDRRGGRHRRRGRGVHPARGGAGRGRRGAPPGRPGHRGAGRRRPRLGRHHQGGGGRGRRRRRRLPHQRRLGLPLAGGRPARRRVGGHAPPGDTGHHAGRPPLRRRGRRGGRTSWSSGPASHPGPGSTRSGSIPGIGFGKTVDHNLELLAATPTLVATGYPVLVGTSRKRFIGVARPPATPRSPTRSTSAFPARWPRPPGPCRAGAQMVRVHDVAPTVQAATLVGRPRTGRRRGDRP